MATDDFGITYEPGASALPHGSTASGQPVRPYASPDQVPQGTEFRSNAFATGQRGETDPGNTASIRNNQDPGLNLSSAQFNSQVGGYRPTSLLQGIEKNPGGLGMSAGDAARRLPTGEYLGSGNGSSESSFAPSTMLRLATGQDAI